MRPTNSPMLALALFALLVQPVAVSHAIAAPVTRAASTKTSPSSTAVAQMEPLMDGSIRFAVPPGWDFGGRSDDGKRAVMQTPDGAGRITITVQPQDRMLLDPDAAAAQMAMVIGKTIREDTDRKNAKVLLAPRVEKDPRFLLKMHDRSAGESGTIDRVQLYRVVGLNMVHVAVNAATDSPEAAKAVHTAAEDLLTGMQLTRGARHIVFPRNQLKIRTPVDWKETRSDQPNGLVVTYDDPRQPARQLIVRARVLPKDAREAGAKRDTLVDKAIDAERRLPPFNDAKPDGAEEVVPADETYLRRVRQHATAGSQKLRVETRYFVVADVLVSLRIVGGEEDTGLAKIADQLVTDTTPIR